MKGTLLFITITCLMLQACGSNPKQSNKLKGFDWVLGYWQVNSPDGSEITESWIRTNDTVYSGQGKYIDSAGSVLSSEEIKIVLREDKLWYIPVVSNQNGGQPIGFKEVSFSDTMIVFENMDHDFPKRIVYLKKGANEMLAYIEGEIEGENQRIDYPYTKQ